MNAFVKGMKIMPFFMPVTAPAFAKKVATVC